MISDDLSAINVLNSKPPDVCLREMLTERLRSGGPLSWRDVCDCLRSSTVQRNDVAEKIEEWRIGTQIIITLINSANDHFFLLFNRNDEQKAV